MSTRCQIVIEGSPIIIYKHSDGYPEGVMPILEPFVERFIAQRGRTEIDYMTAQIIRAFAVHEWEHDAEFLSRPESDMEEKLRYMQRFETVGWGVDQELHGDIEYIYYIRKSGKIEVRIPNRECTLATLAKNSKLLNPTNPKQERKLRQK